ncbi:MAG: SMC-Scp complex subunit ScpB [Synergistales bacterium]|nr:SMC-Scp complex subunit ScpB [Synergistales bacterium]
MSLSQPEGLTPLQKELEALLFLATDPIRTSDLADFLGRPAESVDDALRQLKQHYGGHGLELLRISGGWQLATAPELRDTVARFREESQMGRVRLSRPALETLAVIAYSQPVTRGEVEEIRGVRCDRVVETLLKHGLIKVAGRMKGTGTPLLYRTTERFMDLFGLDSVSDLPSLEELQDGVEGDHDGDV